MHPLIGILSVMACFQQLAPSFRRPVSSGSGGNCTPTGQSQRYVCGADASSHGGPHSNRSENACSRENTSNTHFQREACTCHGR
jgi:hypothetical protein